MLPSRRVLDVVGTEPITVRLARVGEPLQVDVALLGQLERLAVRPGAVLRARREDGLVVLAAEGEADELELGDDLAKHLFVTAETIE